MAEADGSTKKYEPLTEDLVREALRNDKGEAAQLVSWKCEDFTKKGDNYSSFVTSVKVQYKEGEKGAQREVSYVAKLAHQMETPFSKFIKNVFDKEGTCFIEILPTINDALREFHLDDIRTAKGYCMSLKLGKEMIMLEDLRLRNFKMFDRRQGMDVPHANLVLKELGRLHAGDFLAEEKLGCSLTKKWPVIVDKVLQDDDDDDDAIQTYFRKIMEGQMETAATIMEKFPNYKHVVKWIRDTKPRSLEVLNEALKPNSKYDALNHGDCWNNNLLFRYDEEGSPVEVMLVDLQVMRKASVAADLSYFLYSSFTGDVRQNNVKAFLQTYYDSFSSVLRTAQHPLPFSLEELRQEFRDKMVMGCVLGILLIPAMLCEEQDVSNFIDVTEEDMDKVNLERQETFLRMSQREDGQLQDRFFAMFDEMVEAGIISDANVAAQ